LSGIRPDPGHAARRLATPDNGGSDLAGLRRRTACSLAQHDIDEIFQDPDRLIELAEVY